MSNLNKTEVALGVEAIVTDNACMYEEDIDCGYLCIQGEVAKQLRKAVAVARDSDAFTDLDRQRLDVATKAIDITFPKEVTKDE
jgi:hypothetical protein